MITKQNDLLGTLVHDVAHLLRYEIDRRLKSHNLTRAKWLALGIIAKRPKLTQVELAEELELGNAVVGRLIDRLVDRRFVVRVPSPDDRRAYQLILTSEAIALLQELEAVGSELRSDLLAPFSEGEIEFLNRGLSKLKSRLKQLSAAALSVFIFKAQNSNWEVFESIALTA